MSMRRIFVSAFLAVMLLPAVASADELSNSVAAMDPAIQEVRLVGGEPGSPDAGLYRIVIARGAGEHATRLYVQSFGKPVDGAPVLAWTTEIHELADLKLDIASFNAEVEGGGLTVFVEVARPAADAPASYELLVEGDGTYRFDPASN